jgi:cytochrome P450
MLIGNFLWLLLTHQDQLDILKKDYSLIHSAIEEAMRFKPPFSFTLRTVRNSKEIDGIQFSKGDIIIADLKRSGIDSEEFENSKKFDITRKNNQHLGNNYFCFLKFMKALV